MTMLVTSIWQVSVFHSLDHLSAYQFKEYSNFANRDDPWNHAVSSYMIDMYVDPYASAGKGEHLYHYIPDNHIVGLPYWDRVISSISF